VAYTDLADLKARMREATTDEYQKRQSSSNPIPQDIYRAAIGEEDSGPTRGRDSRDDNSGSQSGNAQERGGTPEAGGPGQSGLRSESIDRLPTEDKSAERTPGTGVREKRPSSDVLRFVKPSSVESSGHGMLESARKAKAIACRPD